MKKTRRTNRLISSILRAILLWPVVGILGACGVRFAMVSNPGRIGHIAAEMDCFLKERALGLVEIRPTVLLLSRERAANPALVELFKSHLPVMGARWQWVVFRELAKFDALKQPLGRPVLGFAECARYAQVNTMWGDRDPIIRLTEEIESRGEAEATELGLPNSAWFVCLHVREPGYSPMDERDHNHRNADIASYDLAIDEITNRGGWVVRMGDPTMKPLSRRAGVIDYALSTHKSDWMDLWLLANCRFLLGSNSGLAMVANLFNTPCALGNMVPLGAVYGMSSSDISIPKLGVDKAGTPIPFSKVFRSGLSAQRYSWAFEKENVKLISNTPEDIKQLAVEMLDRIERTFTVSDEDEIMQMRFRNLLSPRDYSFGSSARIGRDWLRQNQHLI